ncbi:hypothetical protein RFEPED_0852 [Rickettsia felis str. Pedreira]|uniref:Uncharacterized protein n=1 Tax=Rickettsia felis str. Pedreira TaxID=1359196 RepID=A0A0F3MS29_RICFI|nr:hypothetical protein [Rickettsia felis]KJV58471.1 hypothetical protein RFEPED_0852 [Rickettsia felis str. Pedreira]
MQGNYEVIDKAISSNILRLPRSHGCGLVAWLEKHTRCHSCESRNPS